MIRPNRLAGVRSFSGNHSLSRTAGGLPAAINLLLSTLDSRVTYNGPVHAYIASDGSIKQSAVNEWPVENNAGRHLPEAAGVNLIKDPRFTALAAGTDQWNVTGGGIHEVSVGNAPDGGNGFRLTNSWSKPAVYNGTMFNVPDTTPWIDQVLPGLFKRQSVPFTLAGGAAIVRFYPSRQDASNYMYYSAPNAAAGSYTMSVFRRLGFDATTDIIAIPQVELGSITTSPILVAGATRTASTVTVAKDGNATGIKLVFNDGTSQSLSFGANSSIALPVSAVNWGTRYLTSIEYS